MKAAIMNSFKSVFYNWPIWLAVHLSLILPIFLLTYSLSNTLGRALSHRNMMTYNFLHFDYKTFSDILNNYAIIGETMVPIILTSLLVYILTKTYVSSGIIRLESNKTTLNSFIHDCNAFFRGQLIISSVAIILLLLTAVIMVGVYGAVNGGLDFFEADSDVEVRNAITMAMGVGILSVYLVSIFIDLSRIELTKGFRSYTAMKRGFKKMVQKKIAWFLWSLAFVTFYLVMARLKNLSIVHLFSSPSSIVLALYFAHFLLFIKTGLRMWYLRGLREIVSKSTEN